MTYKLWKPVNLDETPNDHGFAAKAFGANIVTKGVDSTALGALIRQDLDPVIYDVFVKKFPLFDLLEKIPANGLVHAWNTKDSFAQPTFASELGAVQDSQSSYTRHSTNIAELSVRLAVSLKSQYAVRQGSNYYDPIAEELAGGMTGLAHLAQSAILRYQNTDAASATATTPNGQYDMNAFNGLRYILANLAPAGNSVKVDLTATPVANQTPITDAIRQVCDSISDLGGEATMLTGGNLGVTRLENEQIQFVRYLDTIDVAPGVTATAINAGGSKLPFMRVPGDSVGTYVDVDGHTYQDLFIMDMATVKWAYLGAATPTVLEIPTASDGKLQKVYVPFMFGGLVTTVPKFLGRVQLRVA